MDAVVLVAYGGNARNKSQTETSRKRCFFFGPRKENKPRR